MLKLFFFLRDSSTSFQISVTKKSLMRSLNFCYLKLKDRMMFLTNLQVKERMSIRDPNESFQRIRKKETSDSSVVRTFLFKSFETHVFFPFFLISFFVSFIHVVWVIYGRSVPSSIYVYPLDRRSSIYRRRRIVRQGPHRSVTMKSPREITTNYYWIIFIPCINERLLLKKCWKIEKILRLKIKNDGQANDG